ncbi:MAG: phospho-N-acetylmuramoyl-pentapeptide-transferase [Deltaproteobacteria bacterium]|jgi:phospho-N-acetylmuramoyl-pentapeptide-transferase|nr:MAG: phospho-N-acetylmuramoyl-pentapeptide-transferase [Deltaproteobacteria bacterium]
MLFHLLYPLHTTYAFLNVFKYITFRTIYAALTALIISFFLGPWFIKKVRSFNIGQQIREDGPASHIQKHGTPTMGGALILFALTVSILLWGNLTNSYLWIAILSTLGFGIVGLIDDYKKLTKRNSTGLRAKYKMGGQILIGLLIGLSLYLYPSFSTSISVPFFKGIHPDLGMFYIPFVIFVVVGASNAVNLTDGLDGLAIGPVMIASATYLFFSYFAGHIKIANYLQIPYIAGTGELAVFCGAILGASMGFLWYNTYPAQIFMGDVGSLSLGGALGTVAVITKQEILLVIVGGLFVIEALSVIFQVGSYKLRGKRIFRMAPLHHHFELKGWAEPKVIVRFWIIAVILALVAISTLKIR